MKCPNCKSEHQKPIQWQCLDCNKIFDQYYEDENEDYYQDGYTW